MDATTASGMEPSQVAACVYHAIWGYEKNVLLAPVVHRLAIYLSNIFPDAFASLMAKRASKQKTQ